MMYLRALTALLLLTGAESRSVVQVGHAPDKIAGIEILHGDRGSRPFVSSFDIQSQLSFMKDGNLDAKLKAGNLTHITYTQEDVDLIAQTTPTGKFDFYSRYPVTNDISELQSLPAIQMDLTKIPFEPECCGMGNVVQKAGKTLRRAVKSLGHGRRHLKVKPRDVEKDELAGIPMIPNIDPFYFPSRSKYVNLPLGSPIAYRQVGYNSFYFASGTRAYQVTYRTESTFGNANADLLSLWLPANNDGTHFVSYQMHEDGDNLYCSYSYLFALGFTDDRLRLFLQKKWAVSIPDYQGQDSLFGPYMRNAKSVLDSIRAVRDMRSTLSFTNSEAFMYGYSAGATVTGKASEMAASYAADVVPHILGAAVGGFVNNLTATYYAVNKAHFAGLIPMQCYSLAKEYRDYHDVLYSSLTDLGRIQVAVSAQGCSPTLYLFYGQDMFKIYKQGEAFLRNPIVERVLRDNGLGLSAPVFPFFVEQSAGDQVALVQTVDQTIDFYCQQGTPVSYYRNATGEHGAFESVTPLLVPQFFQSIIDGASTAHPCSSHRDVMFS